MARETNASVVAESDIEAGHTTALAAAQAAYPDLTPVRAYADVTTSYGVITMGKSAVDNAPRPLNVVVNGSTVLYAEIRPEDEPYGQIISRVEERLLTQRRRPRSGSLTLTGKTPTVTPSA